VDTAQSDPGAAVEFYKDLFGWEAENVMPPDEPVQYFMCTLDGRQVAGVGSQPEGMPPIPVWNTYISVEGADECAKKVAEAGGSVMMEPFDVMDQGRMAVFADPAGAAFCVWEPRASQGAMVVNEPGALSWNELTTRDPDGSKEFYGAVFGWEPRAMEDSPVDYTVWHQPGTDADAGVGGMMPMVGEMWPEDLPPHWMVYFAVEDTDAAAEKAKELGGKVIVEPFDTPAGKAAVLNDPNGAAFSIIALSPEAQANA
jgi:predicted enzyme related to lactoylglutathione lyase